MWLYYKKNIQRKNTNTHIHFYYILHNQPCSKIKKFKINQIVVRLLHAWHDQKIDVLSQVQECRSNK